MAFPCQAISTVSRIFHINRTATSQIDYFIMPNLLNMPSFINRCKLLKIGDLKVAKFYKEIFARAAKLNPSRVICNRRTDIQKAKKSEFDGAF